MIQLRMTITMIYCKNLQNNSGKDDVGSKHVKTMRSNLWVMLNFKGPPNDCGHSPATWEGYKRTREGMMCAAFSRGPAAQPSQPALAALGVLVALAAAAPAAAVGVAVAEPAGSLLPQKGWNVGDPLSNIGTW